MAEWQTTEQSIRGLSKYYFDLTKRWWTYSWLSKIAVFFVGVPAMFLTENSAWFALIIGVLAFCGEVASVRSNNLKSVAEGLLRKLDLKDSFGWPVDRIGIADAIVSLSLNDQAKLVTEGEKDVYFASSDEAGWRRAVENLQESSWWSKHLSKTMGRYLFMITVGLVVISVLLLILSSLLIPQAGVLTAVNRIVIALLLLMVSLGLIPLTINYFSFSGKAALGEDTATKLLDMSGDQTVSAIRAWNEYHLARATAPLIPFRLWKMKEKGLNKAWREVVSRQTD